MPTYEYRCTDCGSHVEAQGSFTDPPLRKCESCGGKLRRIFSPVGVLFKGSGFYSTDARAGAARGEKDGGNGEKRPEKAKAETAPASAGGESKTPSKKPVKTSGDAPKTKKSEKHA